MRTHHLLKVVGVAMTLHQGLPAQPDPDAVMIDEANLVITEDLSFEKTDHIWEETIDTSSCLTQDEKILVQEFLKRESPRYPYELQVVENVSLKKLTCLIDQLLQVHNTPPPGNAQTTSNASIMLRRKTADIEDHNWSALLRAGITVSQRLSLGFMYEKDAGEMMWSKKGPEYASGHLRFRPPGNRIRELIIGDYRLTLGQGVLFNNFYRKGLAFNGQVIPKYGEGLIAPYHSLDENRALRGIVIDSRISNWLDIKIFTSFRQLDARMDTTRENITSLPLSGRHMTTTEISGKDAAGTLLTGLSATLRRPNLRISAQGIYQSFNQSLALNGQLYSSFRARGKDFTGMSLSFDWYRGPLNLYGEWTLNQTFRPAGIIGMIWSAGKAHQFCGIFRHLPPNFHQLNAQTLSYGNGQNETGYFAGYTGTFGRFWQLDINADVRINKWWSYLNSPFRRSDQIGMTLRKKRRKHYETYLAIRHLTRHISIGAKRESRWQFRWHLKFIIYRGIEWRMRLQLSHHRQSLATWGWLAYQELKYKPVGSAWSATARFTRHHILDYKARIYAYEVRPGNLFAMPAYNGSGASGLLNLKYKIGHWQLGWYYACSLDSNTAYSAAIFVKVSFK